MVEVMEYLVIVSPEFFRLSGSHLYSHCRSLIVAPNGQEEERDELEAVVEDIVH